MNFFHSHLLASQTNFVEYTAVQWHSAKRAEAVTLNSPPAVTTVLAVPAYIVPLNSPMVTLNEI